MIKKIKYLNNLLFIFDFVSALRLLMSRLLRRAEAVPTRVAGHPLLVRPLNSDAHVAFQIFGNGEYRLEPARLERLRILSQEWQSNRRIPLIIDAGANIGLSALFFADCFPEATVLAVEPDLESFALLQHNCAAVSRIVPIHGAVWRDGNGVRLANAEGDAWARQVAGGGVTPSFTIGQLVARIPDAELLLLKLDIEGAEREACEVAGEVLRTVPCIMIEPHDWMEPGRSCLVPLYRAISGRSMDTILTGENLVLFDSSLLKDETARAA